MIYRHSKLSLTLLLCTLSSSALAQNISSIVETQSGKIQGTVRNNIQEWTGVPYAKPPLGELRWKHPVSPDKWSSTLDATKPAQECIQVTPEGATGAEDCLNLNIYRPTSSDNNLPVLVYIHGGNNQVGSSAEFSPEFIAKNLNAVIVMVNYRLGALGFNPLKALNDGNPLDDSGNYSLLDIRKSLGWVKDNIKSFGGNNNNITVSGFSAGGRDVMAMLISPIFKNSFNKAIVFSGGMTTFNKNNAENIFVERLAPLVVKQKIKPDINTARSWLLTRSDDVRAFMYNLPAKELSTLFSDASMRMRNFPHLYRDGTVIPKDGFKTESYNSVPVILVSGQQEFSLFARNDPMFSEEIKNNTLTDNPRALNNYNFAKKYGSMFYSLFNVNQSADTMFKYYHSPIYGMEFKFGSNPLITGKRLSAIGSFHGLFLPLFDKSKFSEFTQDALKLNGTQEVATAFRSYLKNFLINGTPNGQNLPQWNEWSLKNSSAGKSLLIMDANKQKSIIYMSNKYYTYDDVIKSIEDDNSISKEDKTKIIKNVLNGRWWSGPLDKHFSN